MRGSDYFIDFTWKPISLDWCDHGNCYATFKNAAGRIKQMRIIKDAGVGDDSDDFIVIEIYKRMLCFLHETELRSLRSKEPGMRKISDCADYELARRNKTLNEELERQRKKRAQLLRAKSLRRPENRAR